MAAVYGSIVALAVASSSVSATVTNLHLAAHSRAESATGFAGSTKNLRLAMRSQGRSSTTFTGEAKDVRLSMRSRGHSSSSFSANVVRNMAINASGVSSSTMAGAMVYRGVIASSATTTGSMAISSPLESLTLCQVVSDVLQIWGITCRVNAPQFALDRALRDINAALQTVWNNAEDRDFWSNQTLTFTIADGQTDYLLPADVQNVTGPLRKTTGKRPLSTIGSIGEYESFLGLYLDGIAASEPVAYFIDRANQSTGNDPAKCTVKVTPAVSGDSVSFDLDVIKEAPRYTAKDLKTCPFIPIPHRYTETLLLPVARYYASSFYLSVADAVKAQIDEQYRLAAQALNLADPLPGQAGENKP